VIVRADVPASNQSSATPSPARARRTHRRAVHKLSGKPDGTLSVLVEPEELIGDAQPLGMHQDHEAEGASYVIARSVSSGIALFSSNSAQVAQRFTAPVHLSWSGCALYGTKYARPARHAQCAGHRVARIDLMVGQHRHGAAQAEHPLPSRWSQHGIERIEAAQADDGVGALGQDHGSSLPVRTVTTPRQTPDSKKPPTAEAVGGPC
jgi:hypothetical protein